MPQPRTHPADSYDEGHAAQADTSTQVDGATALPTDAEMLTELLDDLDALAGMVERTRVAAAKGKAEVRLIPRGKVYSLADALDALGDALTTRTLQVRAQRAQRDGVVDDTLDAALEAATGEHNTQ